jgi:hydrogenase maturation protease
MRTDYLIVGVGNTLRHDDGAGWVLAERLGAALIAHGDNVQLRLVQQLLPELAAEIAELAPMALIIADCTALAGSPPLQKLEHSTPAAAHSHGLTPAQLLAIMVRLYEFSGSAWLATVPGVDFAHGEGLSLSAEQAIQANLPLILAQLLAEQRPDLKSPK